MQGKVVLLITNRVCLIFICGLKSQKFADRLRKLVDNIVLFKAAGSGLVSCAEDNMLFIDVQNRTQLHNAGAAVRTSYQSPVSFPWVPDSAWRDVNL